MPYLLSFVGAVHNGCLIQCCINTGNTGILYYFTGYAGYISSALVSYLISFLPGAQCIIGHTYYAKHR